MINESQEQVPPSFTHADAAAQLRRDADRIELEGKIVAACEKYGRKIENGMLLSDAYSIILNCLEDGLRGKKKSK